MNPLAPMLQSGRGDGILAYVDQSHKALRTSNRPLEHFQLGKQLGHYTVNLFTGLTTGLTANQPIVSLRWTDPGNFLVLMAINASANLNTAFGTAQLIDLEAIIARAFTGVDSGGTPLVLSGNNQKMRSTNMGSSLIADLRVATTGTLTAGTRTLDGVGFGHAMFGTSNALGNAVGPIEMYAWRELGQHPLILSANEGIILRVPTAQGATGKVQYYITLEWAEVAEF